MDREHLTQLERAWREASDALWAARRGLAEARTEAARTEAEQQLQRAELRVANIRQALVLFGLEP